jgi:CheY-like chemotaxis protein
MEGGMHSHHVLIVEDDADNRKILAYYIRKMPGVTCSEAADGAEALELLEAQNADLVLMDVNMPNMDGLTATRTLRARGDALSNVTILALTAGDSPRERAACMDAGASDFLSKPIVDPAAFRETIASWLRALEHRPRDADDEQSAARATSNTHTRADSR